MKTRALLLAGLACFLAVPSTPAQTSHGGPSGGKVPLYDDLGKWSHPVTTSSYAAQTYFDQGLRLIYAFNHEEAERSFREAARLDPAMAMAWWGVAYCNGPNINLPIDRERNSRALEAVGKAKALASTAGPSERAYIEAVATRYSPDPSADRATLDRAFADAMRALSRRYPDDLDAATLAAEAMMTLRPWQLWSADGKPAEGTEEIVSILESVIKREPDHPGANHYYIHAVEASPHPERAVASAMRLETLVPGGGHLVHMPAHIWMRTGDYERAVASNDGGADRDRKFFKATGQDKSTYALIYYNHNLQFLAVAGAMNGMIEPARKAAAECAANGLGVVQDLMIAEFLIPTPWLVELRFGNWDAVLRFPEPPEFAPGARAMLHYARGTALAAKGEVEAARAERRALDGDAAKEPADNYWSLNLGKDLLSLAGLVLDARIASAAKDFDGALAAWTKAIAAQDALRYDEPPPWYYPLRESLGGEYLRAGRAADAEKVFREDLERNPRNPRSLFGLHEAIKAQGRGEDATWIRKQFERVWKAPDIKLRVVDL